jgi:hypothetical protein
MSERNVVSVEYNEAEKALLVHYMGGSVHSYSPVSKDEFIACQNAENLSRLVHFIVRRGDLVGKKVEA